MTDDRPESTNKGAERPLKPLGYATPRPVQFIKPRPAIQGMSVIIGLFGAAMCLMGLASGKWLLGQKWGANTIQDAYVTAILLLTGTWCCVISIRWAHGRKRDDVDEQA